jgi:hypothetical protein
MQKSLKIHSLRPYLNFLPTNLSAVSDENANRLYQEIFTMDECYKDKWNTNKLADCYWASERDDPQTKS